MESPSYSLNAYHNRCQSSDVYSLYNWMAGGLIAQDNDKKFIYKNRKKIQQENIDKDRRSKLSTTGYRQLSYNNKVSRI